MLKKGFFVLGVAGMVIITEGRSAAGTTALTDIMTMEAWNLVFISDSQRVGSGGIVR